nr:flagellar protein FliS [candidate division Zixibacteria bacterium]
MQKGLQNYKAVDTLGKSAPELVVKVYDGAIGNLREAVACYRENEFDAAQGKMEKAKKFVVHLYTTLDEEKGGEIARNLSRLYAFVIEQINFVEATKELSLIEDSIIVLNNIREGWVQLAEEYKRNSRSLTEKTNAAKNTDSVSLSV